MGAKGLRIGRVLGVPVFLTPSWFLFAAFVLLSYGPLLSRALRAARRASSAAGAYALMLLASVLLHEVGHCVVARAFGLPGQEHHRDPAGRPDRDHPAAADPGARVRRRGRRPDGVAAAGRGRATPAPSCSRRAASPGSSCAASPSSTPSSRSSTCCRGSRSTAGACCGRAVWQVTGDGDRATVVSAWSGRVVALVVVPLAMLVVLPAPRLRRAVGRDGRVRRADRVLRLRRRERVAAAGPDPGPAPRRQRRRASPGPALGVAARPAAGRGGAPRERRRGARAGRGRRGRRARGRRQRGGRHRDARAAPALGHRRHAQPPGRGRPAARPRARRRGAAQAMRAAPAAEYVVATPRAGSGSWSPRTSPRPSAALTAAGAAGPRRAAVASGPRDDRSGHGAADPSPRATRCS